MAARQKHAPLKTTPNTFAESVIVLPLAILELAAFLSMRRVYCAASISNFLAIDFLALTANECRISSDRLQNERAVKCKKSAKNCSERSKNPEAKNRTSSPLGQ